MTAIVEIRTQHTLLIFMLLVGRSLCCFECSRSALFTMRYFYYMTRLKHEGDEDTYVKVKEFAEIALEDVKGSLQTKMLDHYGFKQIASEYEKCIDLLVHSKLKGDEFANLISLRYTRLKERFKKVVEDYQTRICPNKQGATSCGIVVQVFTECLACESEKTVCVGGPPYLQEWFDNCGCFCVGNSCTNIITDEQCRPCEKYMDHLTRALFCGVKHLKVTEGGDMKLDCRLEWHNKLEQQLKYMFQKVNSSKVLMYTEDHLFLKKGIKITDSGGYICITNNFTGFPISMILFQVKVLQSPSTQEYTFATWTAIATEATYDVEKVIITYASITAIVCSVLIVLLLLGISAYLSSRRESDQMQAWIERKNLEDMMKMIIDN